MTNDERIEAAVEAYARMKELAPKYNGASATREELMEAALRAAYPELHAREGKDATHWLAPRLRQQTMVVPAYLKDPAP